MTEQRIDVPVVDLADVYSSRPERRAHAARQAALALGDYGLVYVKGHGVEPDDLDRFYREFVDVTGREESEKRGWSRPEIWYQRGWTPPNTERAIVAGGQPDYKECFFAACEPIEEKQRALYPELYAENIWPEGAPGFRASYESIARQIHAVGVGLLRACAEALGAPAHVFEPLVGGGPHVTRALRYLPLDRADLERGVLWGEEHTDFNLLTLLPGGRFLGDGGALTGPPDEVAGLYLRARPTPEAPRGRMVRGQPPSGCVVAQVGQQLEILSGGRFQATPHVIKAPAEPGHERVSMAHFIHLHCGATLFPLQSASSPEARRAYAPPVLAGTYSLKTLVDIGLAPPEAIDRLGYAHYDRLAEARAPEGGEA